jgi:cyclohexanecarboxylate-CoA ligase
MIPDPRSVAGEKEHAAGGFWDAVEAAASMHADVTILADDHGRSLTASQFRDAAEATAAWLASLDVQQCDVVSWQLPTVLEAPVLMAACARLGAVQNPIITVFRDREVGFIVGQVGSKVLVVPETWRGFGHASMGRALGCTTLPLELEPLAEGGLRLPMGGRESLPALPRSGGEARWIYYSSGTTAEPKGVLHSDDTLMASSNSVVDQMGMTAEDIYPIAWPFAHIGGMSMLASALRTGAQLVLFDAWDPQSSPERMAAHCPTILGSATPFFLAYVEAQRRRGSDPLFPKLRFCVGGGAPTPEPVNDTVADVLGVRGVIGAWGLTEFPTATSQTPDDHDIGRSVGSPALGVEVRVVEGELRLKGPQCCLGYVDSALDDALFDEDGWLRTGDLGSVDTVGRVHVSGRSKDVIIRNAENIAASEVEQVLLQHPLVEEAAVVGIVDAAVGERVCAVLVLSPGAHLDTGAIAAHCLERGLARFKVPELIDCRAVLPRNPMGKVLKAELRTSITESRQREVRRQET